MKRSAWLVPLLLLITVAVAWGVWDVTQPTDTGTVSQFPALYRQDKTTLQTEWNAEHDTLGGGTGKHKSISAKVSNWFMRIIGQEASGNDWRWYTDAGKLTLQDNTGSEGSPVWVDKYQMDTTTGKVTKYGGSAVTDGQLLLGTTATGFELGTLSGGFSKGIKVSTDLVNLKYNLQAGVPHFAKGIRFRRDIQPVSTNIGKLYRLDDIVMHDGEVVTDWPLLTLDLTATGAGGRDATFGILANYWWVVYAIRNSVTDQRALFADGLIGRFADAGSDMSTGNTDDNTTGCRDNAARDKVAQEMVFNYRTQGVEFVDMKLIKTGAPTGQVWATIYSLATGGGGGPSATVLATSDPVEVSNISTTAATYRFVFRQPFIVQATNALHYVALNCDYAVNAAAFVGWRGDASAPVANGHFKYTNNGVTWTQDATTVLNVKAYGFPVHTSLRYWHRNDHDNTNELFRQASNDRVKLAQQLPSLGGSGQKSHTFFAKLAKVGSPTGSVWFTLQGQSAGNPDGVDQATSFKVDVSTISTTPTWYRFDFPSTFTISSSTNWILLNGDYAVSTINYIKWQGTDQTTIGLTQQAKKWDGSTWANATPVAFDFRVIRVPNLPSGYDQYAWLSFVQTDAGTVPLYPNHYDTEFAPNANCVTGAVTNTALDLQLGMTDCMPPGGLGVAVDLYSASATASTTVIANQVGNGLVSYKADTDRRVRYVSACPNATDICTFFARWLIEYPGIYTQLSAAGTYQVFLPTMTIQGRRHN